MKCPKCHSKKLKTTNSRSTRSDYQTWRRKGCLACGFTVTTYEKPDLAWLSIQDTFSNKRSPYRRFLLTISILEAFDPKNRPDEAIDNMVDTIELKLIALKNPIINTQELVAITLKTLKPVNINAYMHYLATHTSPHNQQELGKLIKSL
jgi:transcriptional regulator NrdR family protein